MRCKVPWGEKFSRNYRAGLLTKEIRGHMIVVYELKDF